MAGPTTIRKVFDPPKATGNQCYADAKQDDVAGLKPELSVTQNNSDDEADQTRQPGDNPRQKDFQDEQNNPNNQENNYGAHSARVLSSSLKLGLHAEPVKRQRRIVKVGLDLA